MTSSNEQLVPVEQIDRDAFKSIIGPMPSWKIKAIDDGEYDADWRMKALVVHRLAALRTPPAVPQKDDVKEALEAIRFGLDFAYRNGLHEFGYDPVEVLANAMQGGTPPAVEPDALEIVRLRKALAPFLEFALWLKEQGERWQDPAEELQIGDFLYSFGVDWFHNVIAACESEGYVAPADAKYLICKGGGYYRPNAQGYTRSKADAGRYTLEEAISHSHPNGPDGPRDGITYELTPAVEPDEGLVEKVAQFLHDEGDFGEAWNGRTWPEHSEDTGQRDGGFVKLVPIDVQAKFREVAQRLVAGFNLTPSIRAQALEEAAKAFERIEKKATEASEWNKLNGVRSGHNDLASIIQQARTARSALKGGQGV